MYKLSMHSLTYIFPCMFFIKTSSQRKFQLGLCLTELVNVLPFFVPLINHKKEESMDKPLPLLCHLKMMAPPNYLLKYQSQI